MKKTILVTGASAGLEKLPPSYWHKKGTMYMVLHAG
jgi:hypothetical protein